MKYIGNLYGRAGKIYFPLVETTEDIDKKDARIAELEAKVREMRGLLAEALVGVDEHQNYEAQGPRTDNQRRRVELLHDLANRIDAALAKLAEAKKETS